MGVMQAVDDALSRAILAQEIEANEPKILKALAKKIEAAKKATSGSKVDVAAAELAREEFEHLEATRAEKYKQLEELHWKS